jgi:hypothetical protein
MYSYNDYREASRREAMAAARAMQQPQAIAATMTSRQSVTTSLISLLNPIISPLSLIIISLIIVVISLVLILLGL